MPLVLHRMRYLLQNGGIGMAGDFVITGGRRLFGTVQIPAAKNSVLPLLAAALLCSGTVRLKNVPRLADVEDGLALLRAAGCAAGWQGADILVCGMPRRWQLEHKAAGRMRASILFCAPLLARLGRAETVLPGGCRIGARPIDLHLEGLARMGVQYRQTERGELSLCAPHGLHGAGIHLRLASVGATETLLLAAASARGETVLTNAAKEPEIIDLASFLNHCGGCVQGAGTSTIRIRGRQILRGGSFCPVADRITASTLACACTAAGGRVELTGCAPALYAPVLETLERMGCTVERGAESAVLARFGELRCAGTVHTGVYPQLATDAAPLLAAVMLGAKGESCICDHVFEHRFGCAEGFRAMGARVRTPGQSICVEPGGRLHGACVEAADLRGGAALVIAALAAQGNSRVTHTEFIDRGYADLAQTLSALGAQIRRETIREEGGVKKRTSKKQNNLAFGAKR